MTLHSDLIATNVNLDTAPTMVTVPYDSSNYTAPPTGSETFRLLKLGDTWNFSETNVYTHIGTAAPVAYSYAHKVTVVNKINPTDLKTYLAFQHDMTPVSGAPAPGAEWDLFVQDPVTREVKIVGNITPKGSFVNKSNTLFSGTYSYGVTYKSDWDLDNALVTFNSTVLGKTQVTTEIPIPGGFQKLDTWIVMYEELSEPTGLNNFDQGNLFLKVNPTIGYFVEADASMSLPLAGSSARVEITQHRDLLSYTLMP